MKKIAIKKARERLGRAHAAWERIKISTNFVEFEPAWSDFLIALNSIHSILDQGARTFPRSDGWFGRKKNERRNDQLLQYLHQARNADEHGIEPIAEHVEGAINIGIGGESVHIEYMGPARDGSQRTEIKLKPANGRLPTIVTKGPHVRLKTVVNSQFGDSFDPPTSHLGSPLADASPANVALLGMRYHEALVDEAEKLVT